MEVSARSLESRIHGRIYYNRGVTIQMIAEEVQISAGTVHTTFFSTKKRVTDGFLGSLLAFIKNSSFPLVKL